MKNLFMVAAMLLVLSGGINAQNTNTSRVSETQTVRHTDDNDGFDWGILGLAGLAGLLGLRNRKNNTVTENRYAS